MTLHHHAGLPYTAVDSIAVQSPESLRHGSAERTRTVESETFQTDSTGLHSQHASIDTAMI